MNVTTGDRWVLDTPSPTLNVSDKQLYISTIEWHPNAAGDDLLVRDGSGAELWAIRAVAGAPNHESIGIERWQNPSPGAPTPGLCLHTMTGGTLYVQIH